MLLYASGLVYVSTPMCRLSFWLFAGFFGDVLGSSPNLVVQNVAMAKLEDPASIRLQGAICACASSCLFVHGLVEAG